MKKQKERTTSRMFTGFLSSGGRSCYIKTGRIMKLTIVLLIVACLQASAAGYSQQITLSAKNVTLQKIFQEIRKQSGYNFLYNDAWLDQKTRVSVEVKNASIEEVLEECFKELDITYAIVDNTIVVKSVPLTEEPQPITITGKVTDSDGKPLPNATVMIKGTFKGITTNIDGEYSITVPDSKTVLVFSYIGFAKQEIVVGNKTTINVTLEQAATELEGVTINAGYYTVKEREKTGNISRIDAKQIEKQSITNPLQALQGRMAGVEIQQTSGLPGSGINLRIRGQNSLRRDGNAPLYIIDGVPYSSNSLSVRGNYLGILGGAHNSALNSINPSDIESIEILKDADATAIYGSRGANGVVLITTKRGKIGKTQVNVNLKQGFGKVAYMMDLLNTEQYLEMRREAFSNDNATPRTFDYDINGTWDENRYTDWQKELIGGTSERTDLQLSINGGNENTQFSIGGGFYREGTVYPESFDFKRVSGRISINHTSRNQKFGISFSANYSLINNGLPTEDLTRTAVTLQPNAPALYDDEGNFNWEDDTFINPIASVLGKIYESKINNLIANTTLKYQIIPELSIKSNFGYTLYLSDEFETSPLSSYNPRYNTTETRSIFSDSRSSTWIIEPQIEFRKKLFNGQLSALVGATFQEDTQEFQSLSASGITSDALLRSIQAASRISTILVDDARYRYYAIFGRINYNYHNKYILNLTARRDGSSRFGPGRQFGSFGAIGMAWTFSNEDFIKNHLSFISFGKLKASYGTTGSDQIGNYGFLSSYSSSFYQYLGGNGLVPSRFANPDYSWETVKKLEVSLDLGFFEDRIQMEISWYQNRSSNQLIGLPLPSITGKTTVQFNWPATVENRGWEIELHTTNIKTTDFEWNTNFNLSVPRNELIAYPNIEDSPFAFTNEVGKSLFVRNTLVYTGVDPETGVHTVEDVNENGIISFENNGGDKQLVKEVARDYYGGIQNSIRYKGFELDFLFQFVKQTGFNYLVSFPSPPGRRTNQPTLVMDRWQKPGDKSKNQKFSQSFQNWTNYAYFSNSDASISDASFIRLSNLSLSYRLSGKNMKIKSINHLRVYIQGQNLFTITNYTGLDPETQSSISLPPLRVISMGLEITF